MRSTAALLAALVLTSLPAVTAAQAVTVTVNGQPLYLNPGPIERNGRVFVPLRGIFERLGASVVYSAGTINATKGGTTVSLQIGSTQATVSGQPQSLDVAPFIVGATTYVPLRFIAQSLGANVNYSDSTRVVAIQTGGGGGAPPYPPPRPMPPPVPPPAPAAVRLVNVQPAPDSRVGDRFTVISAEFSRNVDPGSVRIWLDGANRTYQSAVSRGRFSYKPPAPLDFGGHTVRVSGRGPGDVPFERSWSFTVIRSGPPEMNLTIYQPSGNGPVGRNFTVSGNTMPYARVRVTAGASPSQTGQFNGSTTAGARGNFSIQVSIAPLMGQQTVTVRVTASDPNSGRTTETTMRLSLR